MAVINFGEAEVVVCDRFAKGYPEHAEGELATTGPFEEACATAFPFDAHVTAYGCDAKPDRRLATEAAYALRPELRLFIVDVDGPDHKRTPEWWAAEKIKIAALFKKYRRGYAYTTKGGYRIVWGLKNWLVLASRTDAARWKASYLAWLEILRRDFGIIGDDKCADPFRLFRLPRVRRDGVDVVPDDEIGRADRLLEWDEPYVEPVEVVASMPREVPLASPVDDNQLEAAADALIAAWPPRGRHYAGMALCGALAHAGWNADQIVDFIGYVMLKTVGGPEIAKWSKQADDVLEKIARGENVTGWPSLETLMITGTDAQPDESRRESVRFAITTARKALGLGAPVDLFKLAIDAARPPDMKAQLAAAAQSLRADIAGDTRFAALLELAAEKLLPLIAWAKVEHRAPQRMGMTLRQLRATEIADARELIRGLVPADSVGAISAEPKISKTWVAIDLAISLASATPAFGRFAVDRPAASFYFFAEDLPRNVRSRCNAIGAGKGLDPDGVWTDRIVVQAAGRPLDIADDFDLCVLVASVWLSDEERGGERTELVILDPLSDVHSGEEDKRDSMKPIMARLRAVRAVLGATVAFVHHSKKVGEGKVHRGGQRMRGSSSIHGAVDFALYMDDPRGDRKAEFVNRVEHETRAGRSAGTFDLALAIDDDQNGHAVKAVHTWAEAAAKSTPQERGHARMMAVVQKLFDHGAPLTRDQLKTKAHIGSTELGAALELAENEGFVVHHKIKGHAAGYEITDEGRAFVRLGRASAVETPAPSANAPAHLAALLA